MKEHLLGLLVCFEVFENGVRIGQVFAHTESDALGLAQLQFPGKVLEVKSRDLSYRTK